MHIPLNFSRLHVGDKHQAFNCETRSSYLQSFKLWYGWLISLAIMDRGPWSSRLRWWRRNEWDLRRGWPENHGQKSVMES